MSGHQYFSNSNSLFADDDDVDDETFLKNSRNNGRNTFEEALENDRQMFEQKKREIQERTLQSSHNSIKVIAETEQVGIQTAEELSRQREKLENTSKNLDNINATLRFSQKHLTGLKSVFGGLKNYLGGKSNAPGPSVSTTTSQTKTQAASGTPLSPVYEYDSHPVARLRGDVQKSTYSQAGDFDAQLNANLDSMHHGIAKLKNLALDLNQEIDEHNELIDDITYKVEGVDVVINKQNKDINKLLK